MKLRTSLIGGAAALAIGAALLSGRIDDTYWRVHDAVMGPPPPQNFVVPPANMGAQKVIYHITEKGSWRNRDGELIRLVSVVNNHINAVEPDDIEIEVLMHGNGIDILRRAKGNPDMAARIDGLRRRGVRFVVCANTLQSSAVPLDTLHGVSEKDLVQSAVARIIQLQQQGYGYIRF